MKTEGKKGTTRESEEDDESLLARCLERLPAIGPSAVDEVCGDDAPRKARLRARIEHLERLGLVAGGASDAGPASVGPYRIVDFLGQGGMGEVYLGVHETLGRRAAIKIGRVPVLARGRVEDAALARSRARFEREIRAAASLQHDGIVAIHDLGESDGRPWFAMEFVEGRTLARILDELRERRVAHEELSVDLLREIVAGEGADPRADVDAQSSWGTTYVETVCRWVIQVAEALGHAHAHAIVHRDVKPANVMIRPDGRAKLFDLGLASMAEEPTLTRTGDLTGSPFYMSPEQVSGSGRDVDRRTDVYSLGVTLYELLTLHRPFEGPTSAQIFRQIVGKEPPLPRRWNPSIPRDLETICMAALEKNPARRYPTAEELAADLARFLAFRPVRAKPAGPARRASRFVRRNPGTSSALILGALVLVGLPIGLLWANAAVRAEERRAAREAFLKSKVTDFLVDQFELTETEREKGSTISARELLDRAVDGLEGAFEEDPVVRAELYAAAGRVYRNLGLYDRAIPLLDRALAVRRSTVGQNGLPLAELMNELAGAHLLAGHAETARRLSERGLELVGNARSPVVAGLRRTLADAAGRMGDHGEEERSLTLALEALREQGAPRESDTADVLERLGVVLLDRGDAAGARPRLVDALAIRKGSWAPDVAAIARVLGELARADDALGDAEKAVASREEASKYRVDPGPSRAVDPLPAVLASGPKPEYARSFQAGITALQSGEYDTAIAAFRCCLEIDPARSVPAYNIACGHALAGEVDQGIEWLGRAVDLGFGISPNRLKTAETDPEIASLRADPRGAAILDRMREHGRRVREFARRPAIVLAPPTGPVAAIGAKSSSASGANGSASGTRRPAPLLVVLHDEGSTPQSVVAGAWAGIAHALGASLLAPCGSIPTKVDPEQGMTWYEDPQDLERKPLELEGDLEECVRSFLAHHEVDRDRIWIAGEGVGATVAFDAALRAPGLYKGVLLADGPIHPATPVERARRAASLGMRAGCLVEARKSAGDAAGASGVPVSSVEATGRWLAQCGFADPKVVRIGEGEDRSLALLDVLRGFGG
jgi:serine/threonine protein kinase/predicted esterase